MRAPGPPGLLDAPVARLAERIHAATLSPVALVDAHIEHLRAVNPVLNGLVAERFDAARAEARAAEARVVTAASGESLPPLLGIPCTIKEFIAVDGMPQTAGLVSRRAFRATGDAELVRRLRAAGAIVLGVTNVPEGGLWMETHNRVFGRTCNPWDVARTCGGSSGGEGALVASGASPFGIGSDVGGSIRIPAAFCGVVGHKPTGGLVPNLGHWPGDPASLGRYLTCGPLGRRVEDVALVLRVIAGPAPGDPTTLPWTLGDPASVDLGGVTVFPLETNGRTRIAPVMRGAVRRAAEALEARGARIGRFQRPPLRDAFLIWASLMMELSSMTYAEVLGGDRPVRALPELMRLPFGRTPHTLPVLLTILAESFGRLVPGSLRRYAEAGRRLQGELEATLGDDGVLLHPPYTRPAPRHFDAMRTPLDPVCTAIFNVLEMPSTVVPMGFDRHGLPLSVQVIGRRGNDHLTLGVAGALEAAFGGWVRAEPRGSR